MFSLTKPGRESVQAQIDAASRLHLMETEFLDLNSGLNGGRVPSGFAHDSSRTQLGRGPHAFQTALHAFEAWQEFNLGWVHVANDDAPIVPGQIVAVLAHTLALWSVNLSQIVQAEHTPNSFGFLYKTTHHHIEEGEERFLLTHAPDDCVWYEVETVSRPRHVLARIGVPVARIFQHRFSRDSHRQMCAAVAATVETRS